MSKPAPRSDSFFAAIIEKATKDPAFRERLLADPDATLRAQPGAEIPAGARVKVIEEDPDTIVLTLPKLKPRIRDLDDEQLQSVAGGLTSTYVLICVCGIWVK